MGGLRDEGGVICGAITGVRRRTGREEGGVRSEKRSE